MNELKTLKDLRSVKKYFSHGKVKDSVIFESSLKAEAVKRWSSHHSALDYFSDKGDFAQVRKYEGKMEELEEFFNLTEEELNPLHKLTDKDFSNITKNQNGIDLTEEELMTNEEINAREHGEVGNN